MSIANLSVTVGTRQYKSADGSKRERSAAEKFRYIARYDRHEVRDDLRHSSSGNLPYWTRGDAEKFWQAADKHERKNGTLYVEHLLTLPRDLTLKQHIELVEKWAAEEASDRAYTYAIHYSKAEDGGLNPHCHMMINESLQDGIKRSESKYFKRYNAKNPDRGGCKKSGTGSRTPAQNKQELLRQRQRFEYLCNDALEQANKVARVSLQSYKTRGIDEVPEPKLGYAGWRDEAAKNGVLAMRKVKRELDKKLKEIKSREVASLDAYRKARAEIDEATHFLSQQYEAAKDGFMALFLDELTHTQPVLYALARDDLAGFMRYAALHADVELDEQILNQFVESEKTELLKRIAQKERQHKQSLTSSDAFLYLAQAQEAKEKTSFNKLISEIDSQQNSDFVRMKH